ncbi:MAG: hypothetical protein KKE20_00555 [Nanoarchaeota archaeon]|nr:hypothetical protein [Nanoarchaeota archaeon]
MEISEDELSSWIPDREILLQLMDPHQEFRQKYLASLKERIFSIPGDKRFLEDIVLRTLVKSTGRNESGSSYSRDIFHLGDVDSWQSFYLLGDSGSGKTLYLKRLCLSAASGEHDKLPVYIDLKTYDGTPLDEFVIKQINLPEFRWIIKDMLNHGEFEILLDGYDEMTQHQLTLRDQLNNNRESDNLESSLISRNRIILTGRNDLAFIPEFMAKYVIQPLEKEDIADYVKAKVANGLLNYLHNDQGLLEFFSRPLFLNYLIELYKRDGKIQVQNKSELYRKIIHSRLLREEMRAGGNNIERVFDFSNEINMLTQIGYLMQTGRTYEFDQDYAVILSIFGRFKEEEDPELKMILDSQCETAMTEFKIKYNVSFDEDESTKEELKELGFPVYIIESVLSLETGRLFHSRPSSFDHLSLQEYFCARWFYERIIDPNNEMSIKKAYDQYWSEKEEYKQIKEHVVDKEEKSLLKEGKKVSDNWRQVLIFLSGMLNETHLGELLETVTETYFMNSGVLYGIGNKRGTSSFHTELIFATELIRNSKNRNINTKRYSDKLKDIISLYGCNNKQVVNAVFNLHNNSDLIDFLIENDHHFKVYIDGSTDSVFNMDGTVDSIDHEPISSFDNITEHEEKEFKMNPKNYTYQIGFLLALFNSGNPNAREYLEKAMPPEEFPNYTHVTAKSLDFLAYAGYSKAETALKAQVNDLISKFESETGERCQKYASLLLDRAVESRLDSHIAIKYMEDYAKNKTNPNRREMIRLMLYPLFSNTLKEFINDTDEPHWKEALENFSYSGSEFVDLIENNTNSYAMLPGGRQVPFKIMASSIKNGAREETDDQRKMHRSTFDKYLEKLAAYHWDKSSGEDWMVEDEPEFLRYILRKCGFSMAYPSSSDYEGISSDDPHHESRFFRLLKRHYDASQELTYSYSSLDHYGPVNKFVLLSLIKQDTPWRKELMHQISEDNSFDLLRIFAINEKDPDRDYAINLLKEKGEWNDG